MENQQNNQTYEHTSRFTNWETKYCESIHRQLYQETSDGINSGPWDEVSVEFVNVQDKLSSLKEEVDKYNSEHKTSRFYYIQDTKNELQLKLDSIELNNQEDLRVSRTELFRGLEKVANQLNSKIHEEGTSACRQCHQRAIVVPQLTRKEY